MKQVQVENRGIKRTYLSPTFFLGGQLTSLTPPSRAADSSLQKTPGRGHYQVKREP